MGIEFGVDEQDKKRELQRLMMRRRQIDRTSIANASPEKRYKLVNSDPRGVNAAKAKGFEMVPKSHDESSALPEHGVWDESKGCYMVGDLAVMQEPIELYEESRRETIRELDAQISNKMEGVADDMNRIARNEGRVSAHTDIAIRGDELIDRKEKARKQRRA